MTKLIIYIFKLLILSVYPLNWTWFGTNYRRKVNANNDGYQVFSEVLSNKTMHATNGNILKVVHLNKGSSNIDSKTGLAKMELIKNLVKKTNCDILSLNEAQIDTTDPNQTNPIDGFNFEHCICKYNGLTNFKSRVSIGIKNGINYVRMNDLEHEQVQVIWLKIKCGNGDI